MTYLNQFGTLFKKYRLLSEIETLSEFGNLLADEGMIYETSLFTKWQKGNRIPKDRKILLSILKVFVKKGGIHNINQANQFLQSTGSGYLTDQELTYLPNLADSSTHFLAPRRLDHFIDRESLTLSIKKRLLQHKTILLYGPPGIGKTTLSIHICHDVTSLFQDGILWYQLDSSSPMDILLSIAHIFGKDISNIQDITIRSSIIRSLTADKRLLFVYDNVDDISNLEYLLPVGNNCSTLITSINPFFSSELIETRIQLNPFDFQEAFSLFQMINGNNFVRANLPSLNQLFNVVEGLPLALRVIAKQIYYSHKPIENYLRLLKEGSADLTAFAYQNKSLDIVLTTTFNKLSSQERQLLISASVFQGKDFSINAVSYINSISYDSTLNLLEKLENYSLIEHSVKDRFRMHPLIRLFLKPKASKEVYIKAAQYYIDSLKHKISKQNYYITLNESFDNIKYVFEYCIQSHIWSLVIIFWQYLSDYLWHTRHWSELEQYGLAIYKQRNKHKNVIMTSSIVSKLSNLYYWKGNLSEAEKFTKEGIKFADIINDKNLYYSSKLLLGRILIGANRLAYSERILMEGQQFFKNKNDKENLSNCYKYIGEMYLRKQLLQKAFQKFSMAYEYYKKSNIKASNMVNQAITLIYLGEVYLLKNDVNNAQKSFLQGLNFCKKSNETWGIQTFGNLGLGLTYELTGKIKHAKECYKKVQKGFMVSGFKEYLLNQNTFYYGIKNVVNKSQLFKTLFQ